MFYYKKMSDEGVTGLRVVSCRQRESVNLVMVDRSEYETTKVAIEDSEPEPEPVLARLIQELDARIKVLES